MTEVEIKLAALFSKISFSKFGGLELILQLRTWLALRVQKEEGKRGENLSSLKV